eukprot:g8087.t1
MAVSSEKPKCSGVNPWAKRLKKPIIHDTQEKLTLKELLTDFVFGVAAGYDGRQLSDELTELVAGYAQSKADRPVQEQSLSTLTGKEQPPDFHVKLMTGPNAAEVKGPYGPDELHSPKENGRIMVKGSGATKVTKLLPILEGPFESSYASDTEYA